MPIHLRLEDDEACIHGLLHDLPSGDVRSTAFVLTRSGSRMPGNYLTVWLAHPRGLPCRHRRILRVEDRTFESDEHSRELLASECYDALRELHWSAYRYCLPLLLDFLALTPNLRRLHVHALREALAPLAESVPERLGRPPLDRPYTFSLVSFECSAILTGDLIARIIACSARTLQHLYLLIHACEFDVLAPELPALPALKSLTLLPASESFTPSLLHRVLLHCPRLTALAIAVENPDDGREWQFYAAHFPRLNVLTLYSARRPWSHRATESLRQCIKLRALKLVTVGFDTDGSLDELRRVCIRARIALRVIVSPAEFGSPQYVRRIMPVSYAGMPRV